MNEKVANPSSEGAGNRVQILAKAGLEDLIPGYISNRHRDILSLADALAKDDLKTARSIGHGMKGTGSGYGFPAISEIGRGLEQAALGQDAAGIRNYTTLLAEYLSRLEVVYPQKSA
jgi:HPt (histidine-containing phosphotransfer) domain-containing protein